MQTMDLALERLARTGVITPQAAFEKDEDKESFRRLFPVLAQDDH
jgi:hypothetical protein